MVKSNTVRKEKEMSFESLSNREGHVLSQSLGGKEKGSAKVRGEREGKQKSLYIGKGGNTAGGLSLE